MQRRHQKRQCLPLAAGKQADLCGHALFQPKAKARKQLAVILPLCLRHAPAKPASLAAPVCQRQVFFDLHIRRGAHHGVLKTRPMNCARLYSGIPVTSSPPMKIEPASTGQTPATAFSSVDLPAPLPPMTVTKSPSASSRLRSRMACFH